MERTRDLLADATRQLAGAGVPSPAVDAELLLAHVTGAPRGLLRLRGSDVDPGAAAQFRALIAQRARRVPLQHLTGSAPFRHLELAVGPGVFIPRPETELIVDEVRRFAGGAPGCVLVDLCTGSGALAISLATELPGSSVTAVELAPEALVWAQRNVTAHAGQVAVAGSALTLVCADATGAALPGGPLAHLAGLVDVVVSNPPYVPDAAIPREPEVCEHDPAVALYGGTDGLDVVRALVEQAALLLRPGGLLVVEHADVQGEDAGPGGLPGLLRAHRDPDEHDEAAWTDVSDHLDLSGRPRHTLAIRMGRMSP
ncbi:MAG: peptide chain release factor N(5)-glutamine methyltransferase [Candidatus Nanopelagicales bacterium]